MGVSTMKKSLRLTLLAGGLLGLSALAAAGEHLGPAAEAEAWTPQALHVELADVGLGDPVNGRQVHEALMCASCHGEAGVAPSRNYPSLAGQRAEYTYKVLLDYRDARRHEGTGQAEIMFHLVQLMTEADMRDVASYYAGLPLPGPVAGARETLAVTLVRHGDPTRLITPCASCHGAAGEGGINETPALAGQVRAYFVRTMQAFREGARVNDVYEGMGQFTHELSDEEIRALADYYAALGE